MSAAAMSRHRRVPRTTGLVEAAHQGDDARVRVYRLKPHRFRSRAESSDLRAFANR
jgi:hypothetical protein